jgi:hypothetical protein
MRQYYTKINKKQTTFGLISNNKFDSSMKYITDVLQSNCWSNRRCFIIGGGPSLEKINLDFLDRELTIGTNKAFIKMQCTINYCMDERMYNYVTYWREVGDEQIHKKWKEYTGIKLFLLHAPNSKVHDDTYMIKKIDKKVLSFDLTQGIYPGKNSGFGALMLAIALGANPIYLLGYDMKVDRKKTHWHKGYPKQLANNMQSKLKRFMKEFEQFAALIAEQEIHVINIGKESSLTCFEKKGIEEIHGIRIKAQ